MIKEGRILLVGQYRLLVNQLSWEIPGGKIDDDETPKECLKRELMEELNIETEIGDFICSNTHDYGDFKIDLHLYKVKSFSGNIIKSEHEDIKWISKEEFDSLLDDKSEK